MYRVPDKSWGHRPDSYWNSSYAKLFPVAAIDTVETRIVGATDHQKPDGAPHEPKIDYDDDNATDFRTGARLGVYVAPLVH